SLENSKVEAYAFRRRNYIGSRWVKVCGWYPDYCVRLYNARKTKFSDALGHAVVLTEKIHKLDCDLMHWSFRHSGELFSKADRFSTRGAKILLSKGKTANALSPFVHGFLAFFKKYFFKLGF